MAHWSKRLLEVPHKRLIFLLRTRCYAGAQIIDMMLLVIDAKKGIQTQTAECLVIAEVLIDNLVVVLNKVDQFPPETRDVQIQKVTEKLRMALSKTKFGAPVIIPVAADVNASGVTAQKSESIGIDVRSLRGNCFLFPKSPFRLVLCELHCIDAHFLLFHYPFLNGTHFQTLAQYLANNVTVPKRDTSKPFYFSIDHCFPISESPRW